MSRREDVQNSLWANELLPFSSDAKLLAIWSTTNPHCNLAGIYKVAEATMRFELGLSPRRLERALDELQRARWLHYDSAWLWVPERVARLGFRNPNIARSIVRDLRDVGAHPYRVGFLDRYRDDADNEWLQKALGEFERAISGTVGKPLGNGS